MPPWPVLHTSGASGPGPLRGWCFSPLVISTHLSHPFPSLLPPVYYTALGFFFFSISWSKSFHELGRKAKKGWTCSGRKPRSNLSFQVSPVKSFLSVTKMQLMVPCYLVHSLALFSAALGKKLSQLPMLINHANYGRWKLSNSGLL